MRTLETKGFFSVWNHHKCLIHFILIHLNTGLWYGYTSIINNFTLTGDRLQSSESDVHRRQILTSIVYPRTTLTFSHFPKVDSRTVRVNIFITAYTHSIDIQMKRKQLLTKIFIMISNWKKPLVSMAYTKIFQRFNPYSAGIDFRRQNLTSADVWF